MPTADQESRQPPTSASWWEGHRLVARSRDGLTGLAMQVSVKTSGSRNVGSFQCSAASFQCAVFRHSLPTIVIAESEIEAPAARWEFRTSGLWADTICETPFEHWSYGLEAFGLEIVDPAELLGRGYGDRVPLGWELEFESETAPESTTVAEAGYDQTGIVHGLLLFAGGESDFGGPAVRQHWWGSSEPAVAQPVLADLANRINRSPLAAPGPATTTTEASETVALPLDVPEDEPWAWWLTHTADGFWLGAPG